MHDVLGFRISIQSYKKKSGNLAKYVTLISFYKPKMHY